MRFIVLLLTIVASGAYADSVDDLLAGYGPGPYDPVAGEAAWTRIFQVKGDQRTCADCHTTDLNEGGKHWRTGKAIEPLAPSVNPARLTDAKKIEKWLLRNCKWTLGRECTPREKGNYLVYIRGH